ncbi:monocarboxylate transporter 12-B-like [Phyllopteryx taeniolatus]|uniref:monocarboxylate transporter 12-B-like n=1 Tax=Phyllopteryx taeniolatus TaxID=161469 RepID=UPI002AD38BFF|nr:monocarboxylate transporter 12-B-like [Phyllopteryx taeniolatus]XP_061647112.1 monocarboxylate transporter 12-B-like [Phyllopteryx taeniolatus]XP_061647113.1 monocarboxylate transporter 12-B-like [Phyllopteryx taeniolatus]XP_061647114.1 monocarboxylate transporter 12-B-like [Phyllopteryx taeniolatus]
MAVSVQEKPRQSQVTEEGGWGWIIVAACFLATVCTRAVTRCVSMFFVEFQLHFERDYSTTAWIHSLVDCTTMLCAPLGGFLGNRLSCRATVTLGGLLSSVGLVLGCFASSLEHLYVSLGILTGMGFALCYTPSIAMVGRYFSKKKALAYGIAQSGSGIGTFILAPVVQLLIDHYSWRGAMLVLGGFVSNLCVCGALMRPVVEPSEKQRMSLESKDESKEVPAKRQEISNLSYTEGLLIANGVLRNCQLENSKLTEVNKLAEANTLALLSSGPGVRLTDLKVAECLLLSNTLTAAMLGELADNKLASTVESPNLSNRMGVTKTEVVPSEPLVTANIERGRCYCLQRGEDFGFLVVPNFLVLASSFLFLAYGCSTPMVYLVPYALSKGLEHKQATFIMSTFGISGIVGNITFGWITDRKYLKRYRILSYILAIAVEGLSCLCVPLLHSFAPLSTFAVVYGYFDGAYVALIPVVTSDAVGSAYLTSALGVVYFLHAVPYLVSPPIGGWLVDMTENYTATFLVSGASFICSAAILAVAMLVRRSRRSGLKASCPEHAPTTTSAPAVCHQDVI